MGRLRLLVIVVIVIAFGATTAALAGSRRSNPYIPKKLNIWLDDQFFKLYSFRPHDNDGYEVYSTEADEKELMRQLLDLVRLQLEANLILIKQNEEMLRLMRRLYEKGGDRK